jgi:hypothetical protein
MKKSHEFNHLADGALIDEGTKEHSRSLSDATSAA